METKTELKEVREENPGQSKSGGGVAVMDESAFKSLREELADRLAAEIPPGSIRIPQVTVHVEKIEDVLVGNEDQTKRILEALLFASSKPLTINEIKKVLRGIRVPQIEKMIGELKEEYARDGRSFKIQEVAGGYEIATDVKYAPWIMKLELQKRARQASQSALETLSILVYKQPATRQEIEDLRGVDVSGVISTLLERNLIRIVGRKEVPGRPFLYGTTEKFLEHFGLKSIADLPQIQEIRELVEKAVPREKLLGKGTGTVVDVAPEVPAAEVAPFTGLEEARANAKAVLDNLVIPDVPKLPPLDNFGETGQNSAEHSHPEVQPGEEGETGETNDQEESEEIRGSAGSIEEEDRQAG